MTIFQDFLAWVFIGCLAFCAIGLWITGQLPEVV